MLLSFKQILPVLTNFQRLKLGKKLCMGNILAEKMLGKNVTIVSGNFSQTNYQIQLVGTRKYKLLGKFKGHGLLPDCHINSNFTGSKYSPTKNFFKITYSISVQAMVE